MERQGLLKTTGAQSLPATTPSTHASVPATLPEENIKEIISEDPGWGGFKKKVSMSNDFEVMYYFSFAVVTGSLAYSEYREKFGTAPIWVGVLHPLHSWRLRKRAVASNLPLPERLDFNVEDHIATQQWAIRSAVLA